jgi:hypothetical protein
VSFGSVATPSGSDEAGGVAGWSGYAIPGLCRCLGPFPLGAGCATLKTDFAAPEPSVATGLGDSCGRYELGSFKCIDVPQRPERRPAIPCARLRTVVQKFNLFPSPFNRSARLHGAPEFSSETTAGILIVGTGMRGNLFALCRSAPLQFRQPIGSALRSRRVRLLPGFGSARFLRAMEEEILNSTHFGILMLKRFSRGAKAYLSVSRGH